MVFGIWGPNNGHCTFLSGSFTPNGWFPWTQKDYDFSTASWNYALCIHPDDWLNPKAF
jgi:hypothetical protein